ncbi:hypothetical protein Tco_0185952 [Tanacetum coccineum]
MPRGTTQRVTRGHLMISVRCTGTRYCSSTRWQTRQYERQYEVGVCNNEAVGGVQNDQNTPRSSNMSGWRLERTKLPPPTWAIIKDTQQLRFVLELRK